MFRAHLMDNCSKCLTQEKTIIFLYLFILSIHLFSLVSNFNCNLFCTLRQTRVWITTPSSSWQGETGDFEKINPS